jgi:hypothetical protein
MVSFILPGNSASGGYEVANSLRFDDGSSDYLVRTPSSSGNRQTFTISFWYKRTTPGTSGSFIRADNGSGIDGGIRISTDSIQFFDYNSSYKTNLVTTQLLRDVSAWYHIVCVADTTNSTSGDRALIYLNGTRITDFSSETYPTQDLNFSSINDSSFAQNIGRSQNFATYLDGYLAEFCFIDGQALTPTSFGEFDSDTNIWKPINVSGLTFGTNGFYLDFENSSSLGADVSGNGNNFTVNNLTSIDQSTDTCTNNFATLNPIDKPTNSSGSSGTLPTLSNGNLSVVNTNSAFREARSTYYLTTGKWYWETKMTRLSNTLQVGVVLNNYSAGSGERRMYQNNGNKYISSSSSYGATFTTNDIIGIALNLDDGEITFYKNGTTQGVAATDLVSGIDDTGWTPAVNCYDADCDFNFGSPPYSISSGNSDANGYGNFEYSVPSGYYSLCTKNLADYG